MDTKVLRQKILDLAIRGKLVPQDPNDEPASVLLERIREQKKQMVKEGKLKAKDIKNDSVIFVGEDNLHYEKFADGSVKCIEDEIPFELPDGWAWTRLASVLSLSSGKAIKVRQLTDVGEYPVYGGNGINGTYFDYNVEANTIIIGRVGYYCGSVYKTISKAWVTDNALIATVKEPAFFELEFLVEVLKYLNLGKTSVSTAQPVVSGKGILPLIVPVPPKKEQINILKSYNQIVPIINILENDKEKILSLITTIKSKILDLAIRGQLVSQNPDDEPSSVLLERIRAEKEELIKQGKIKRDKKESIIFKSEDNSYYEKIGDKSENINVEIPFDLPEDWNFVRLKEIWELISGRDLSPSEYNADGTGIPYITGASNFINGKVELVRWTSTPQVLTETGDLLFTCKGTIGEMAFNDFGTAHIARQIMAIRNIFGLNSEYLALCMDFYIHEIKNAAKGLIPGISREDILNLILPIPPEKYQKQVVLKVQEINVILSAIEKSLS